MTRKTKTDDAPVLCADKREIGPDPNSPSPTSAILYDRNCYGRNCFPTVIKASFAEAFLCHYVIITTDTPAV